MLPLAEDDLRSSRYPALLFFLVLHQVGSSHCQIAPAESFPKLAERRAHVPQIPRITPQERSRGLLVASADYVPCMAWGKVWCVWYVPDVQPSAAAVKACKTAKDCDP
jgi:hypothetical protein